MRTWQMEPLPAAVVAGLTPADVDIAFFDDRMEPIARRLLNITDVALRMSRAKAGEASTDPHQHLDSYQITWVLSGEMLLTIHGEEHKLKAGEAIKFDAAFEHTMRFPKATTYIVALVPKRAK